jgi:serine/threonine protein kinase
LYALSEEERAEWLEMLRMGACAWSIHEFYSMGKQIGVGKYSTVHEARHVHTGKEYAVKIIPRHMNQEFLRREIAVHKLLHHPNIITLKDVFETRSSIYIGEKPFFALCRRRSLPFSLI